MKLITMSREEWLSERKKGVGGSDIAAICGLSQYRSRKDVWLDKLGLAPEFEDNKFTKAGRYLEQVVADMFAEETDNQVYLPTQPIYTGSKPYYKYSIDRIGVDSVGSFILECKTTQKRLEEPLDEWILQATWYTGHKGLNSFAIAWLERGVDFKYKFFDLDRDLFQMLCDEADVFWNEVETETEPEPRYAFEQLAVNGTYIEASDFLAAKVRRAAELKEEIKEREELLEAINTEIKSVMGIADVLTYQGQTLVTYKNRKGSSRIDAKALEKDMPEVYEKYIKTGEPTRTFLIKI